MRVSRKEVGLSVVPLAMRPVRSRVSREVSERIGIKPDEFETLREEALRGRPGIGLRHLAALRAHAQPIDYTDPNAPIWLSYVAQWTACVPGSCGPLSGILEDFTPDLRAVLPINAYGHLRLAEGIVALEAGEWESAGLHLDFAVTLAKQQPGQCVLARLGQFWSAVLFRRQGRLDSALERIQSLHAGTRLEERGPLLAMEGLLNIEKDKSGRGLELLRGAEELLSLPEDWFWLSAVFRGFAKVALPEARYEQAHEWLLSSAALFQAHCPDHPRLPSLLTGLAAAQRLTASRLARTVDLHAAERRRKRACHPEEQSQAGRRRIEDLRASAFENLRLAEEAQTGGAMSQVTLEKSRLLADCGQLDLADREAATAFRAGAAGSHLRTMTQARLIQGRLEYARFEDGIGTDPGRRAQLAHDLVQEAAGMATRAGDQRLLAEAHTLLGTILAAEPLNDLDGAREHCERAGELIGTTCRDWLWEDYQALVEKVLRSGAVDSKLRRWSQGLVDTKTFQQMTEEFADLVIPCVWEREGRNVSRVVAKLSISPKKVRRILHRVGLKPGQE